MSVENKNIWEAFEEIFNSIINGEELTEFPLNTLYPSYPPTDIYLKEDKTLIFEFAVAGYPKEAVDLSYYGDHLILKLDAYKYGEKLNYLKQGIKHSNVVAKYVVPTERYDLSKLEAELSDGILKVVIPAKEKVESKKINIKK